MNNLSLKKIKTLLVVEDNKATCFLNQIIIKKTGLVENIMTVNNGKEALAIIESDIIPEIILLDINMPIFNGWDFLNSFYKHPKYSTSKIVIMLGETLSKDMLEIATNKYNIYNYISKVISKSELTTFVEDYNKQFILKTAI